MPALTLLRHAKSSWSDDTLDDRERPLNARGNRDAPAVAALLSSLQPITHVLCSPALRTRQTLQHLIGAGAVDPASVTIEPTLYLASSERIETLIHAAERAHGTAVDHLLVIGHNPGLETLAGLLGQRAVTLKTSSLCRYERADGNGSWRMVEQHTPRG